MTDIFMEVIDPDTNIGRHPVVTLTDGITETVYHQFMTPADFAALTSCKLIVISGGTGNMVASVASNFAACTQAYNTHTDSIGLATYACTLSQLTCIDVSAALTGLAAGDLVGISLTRQGGHGSDTVNANCYYVGLLFSYT